MSVRIIGGVWRGTKLLTGGGARLRPSGDRLRESLFNCLGQRLSGLSCLDLFAGSGALGLEAASRGAARVVFVERRRQTAARLREQIAALGAPARVFAGGAAAFLQSNRDVFDLVFLDPPFADYPGQTAWERLLAAVLPHVQSGGRVFCESAHPLLPPAGWRAAAAKRCGRVHWRVFCGGAA